MAVPSEGLLASGRPAALLATALVRLLERRGGHTQEFRNTAYNQPVVLHPKQKQNS